MGFDPHLFQNILKSREIYKKMRRLAEEENGNQSFIKNGTLEPKEAFGMKSLGDLKLFENQNLSNYS